MNCSKEKGILANLKGGEMSNLEVWCCSCMWVSRQKGHFKALDLGWHRHMWQEGIHQPIMGIVWWTDVRSFFDLFRILHGFAEIYTWYLTKLRRPFRRYLMKPGYFHLYFYFPYKMLWELRHGASISGEGKLNGCHIADLILYMLAKYKQMESTMDSNIL